jgi:transposase-like protein
MFFAGSYQLLQDDSDAFVSIVITTSDMKADFDKFPELLAFDATYGKNVMRLPIYVYMIIDGDCKGRVVSYALVQNERVETVEATLRAVKNNLRDAGDRVRTILIDKDMSEIGAIKAVFPNVHIEICLFHSAGNILGNLKTNVKDPQQSKPALEVTILEPKRNLN